MRRADAIAALAWVLLALAGAALALLMTGVLLIADKPYEPRRYLVEVGTAVLVLLLGLGALVLGGWRAWRRGRAPRL